MTHTANLHALYLHGFASSPGSSKAEFFAQRLASHGIDLHRPDLNDPDFSTLTISRMVEQTEALLDGLSPGPAAVIGSSLGAFVAWHVAARAEARTLKREGANIARLVLLAPAFDFGANRLRELGDEGLARWRETGWHTFFHYAYQEPRAVHFRLYEDAQRYRTDVTRVTVPTLVFQGTHDESVNPDMVIDFASRRSNIVLRLLDDDHQLQHHVETMWADMAAFLGLQ